MKILVILQRKLAGTADTHQQRNGALSKAKKNVLVTMLLTGSLFVICWTPMQMLRFLHKIGIVELGQPFRDTLSVCKSLVMCNMCVNPVVYCFKYNIFVFSSCNLYGKDVVETECILVKSLMRRPYPSWTRYSKWQLRSRPK